MTQAEVYNIIKHVNFPYFSSVEFITNGYQGLARVYPSTGKLLINLNKWNTLPWEHKFFVLCHEEGHVALQSKNEYEVDAYAFDKYVGSGLSLKESVRALTAYLNKRSPVHNRRALLQLNRALAYDKTN